MNLCEIAAPELACLSCETGEAVYIAVRENLNVVCIDKLDSQKPIRSRNAIGGTAPLHCVGTGKALLAAEFAKLRDQISDTLTRYTQKTMTDMAALEADITRTLGRGYVCDTGEFRERILSFGAAITLPGGDAKGALGISQPDTNLPSGGVETFGGLVAHAANSVLAKLGRI